MGKGPLSIWKSSPSSSRSRNVNKSYRRGSQIIPVLEEITFDIARESSSPSWARRARARAPC